MSHGAKSDQYKRSKQKFEEKFEYAAAKYREKIEEFKSKMPVIRTLGNPGFRDRHWENVSNIVGFPVKGGSNLFQILDMGLDEYVSKFEKIRYSIDNEFIIYIVFQLSKVQLHSQFGDLSILNCLSCVFIS